MAGLPDERDQSTGGDPLNTLREFISASETPRARKSWTPIAPGQLSLLSAICKTRPSSWRDVVVDAQTVLLDAELLDHVIVPHKQHLRRLLCEYWTYYNEDGAHLRVDKDAPVPRSVEQRPAGAAVVQARRRVGGLHHRYSSRTAA